MEPTWNHNIEWDGAKVIDSSGKQSHGTLGRTTEIGTLPLVYNSFFSLEAS